MTGGKVDRALRMADPPPRRAEGGVMPGPEPPRRNRFQIHLSTAVVMMFVAGGIMWGNIVPSRTSKPEPYLRITESYGWPLPWQTYYTARRGNESMGFEAKPFRERTQRTEALVIDVLFAPALLFAVWVVCEGRARRRAARKGA
jgi:hypothetical protein